MLSDLGFSVDVTGLMNQLNCSAGAFLCLKCTAWWRWRKPHIQPSDHLHRFSSILDTLHGEFTRQFQDILYCVTFQRKFISATCIPATPSCHSWIRGWFSLQPFQTQLQSTPVQAGGQHLMKLTEPHHLQISWDHQNGHQLSIKVKTSSAKKGSPGYWMNLTYCNTNQALATVLQWKK